MLNLAASTDKLKLVTSAAATVDVHGSYVDVNGTTFTPGQQLTAISTATTTDIVAAPAASTTRNVKFLSIRNRHASTSCDVTVQVDRSATAYDLIKVTLTAGEELVMREGIWFHYDSQGGVYGPSLPTASTTVAGAVALATQALMEGATDAATAVTPQAVNWHPGTAKFWVVAGVTGNNLASWNVTSLTDTGTGILTITIATDFSSVNYCVGVSVEATATTWAVANTRECHIRNATLAVGSVAVDCVDNTATTSVIKDPSTWHVIGHGDQ